MELRNQDQIVDAIVVTAEIMGDTMRPAAAAVMASELSEYPVAEVFKALKQCRREIKGKLTMAAIIERIDDGHPGPNEAWSIAIRAHDERNTVVWTGEMARAFECARALLDVGDKVAARMAFLETYSAEVKSARTAGRSGVRVACLGFDAEDRKLRVQEAIERGLLSTDSVDPNLLASESISPAVVAMLPARFLSDGP